MGKEKISEKKRRNSWSWLLWWQIDKVELRKQADRYNSLDIFHSVRGISFLLLIFSAVVTIVFILFFKMDGSAFFDIFLFLILGYFIFRGHKWAMIGAMVLWTYEKLFILFQQYQNIPTSGSFATSPIISLIWWAIYMHAFYEAFQVESLRSKK